MALTYQDIKNNEEIRIYIKKADQSLEALGYTEHAFAHMTKTALTAAEILEKTGYPERTVELAKIAGYMHDIGNVVNRTDHAQSGAVMAFRILDKLGMPADEVATVICAIGNHDEHTAFPVNEVAAALILADKSDVRRSRVRNHDFATFDIHDRVNYAVTESKLQLDTEEKTITLSLTIDTAISSVMDYFEIFMQRMLLCRRAAAYFDLTFRLTINNATLL
jgi:metal-dependent HD superfamily phosphatase/phosphodiesterase